MQIENGTNIEFCNNEWEYGYDWGNIQHLSE